MQLIPAIDIKQGRCVRLFKGRRDEETRYHEDPVSVARHWEQQGARRLHLVDLDGAFETPSENRRLIERILEQRTVPCQVGGGLRSTEAVDELLDCGADAAIIGTAGVENPSWLEELVDVFGAKRIVAGVDCRNDRVMVKGWEEESRHHRLEWCRTLESLGVRRVIYTDVDRDGTQQGPDVQGTLEILENTELKVIGSGGVGTLQHLESFVRLNHPRLAGVIVGRALYEGSFSLEQARKVFQTGMQTE